MALHHESWNEKDASGVNVATNRLFLEAFNRADEKGASWGAGTRNVDVVIMMKRSNIFMNMARPSSITLVLGS